MNARPVDDAFPALVVHPDRVLFRVHRHSNDPVHFSASGHGRFDLVGVPSVGTCYLAPSPLGAYLETLGRLGTISWDDIEERRLSELTLARPLRLADLTARSILGRYGLAGDISTGTDYRSGQTVAGTLYELGFDGIYYTALPGTRCGRLRTRWRAQTVRRIDRPDTGPAGRPGGPRVRSGGPTSPMNANSPTGSI